MEPPVSVPIASGDWYEASAAEEPPPEPPGMRVRSQGLPVGPYALFSVDDPMANSSMLVLPRMTTSAALSRLVSVASYGGIQPSRILEPTVVGMPSVVKMSLSASGTPYQRAELLAPGALLVDGAGLREGALTVDVQEGVHLLVYGLDPGQVGLGDLDGGQFARGDLPGDLGGGELDDVAVRHGVLVLPRICGTLKRCCSWAGAPESACSG